MTKVRSAILSFIFIIVFSSSAFAVTPEEIKTSMIELGYTVEIDGDVVYVNGAVPVAITVSEGDGDISYFTYIQDISSDLLGYEFLNRYNNDIKFGRAYVDEEGDIAIQMDRNSSGGISMDNIASDFEVFVSLVQKFKRDVGAQAAA